MRPITAKLESRKRISLTVPIVLWFLIIGVSPFGYSVMMLRRFRSDYRLAMAVSRPYDSRVVQAWENGEYKSSTARPDCGTFGIRG
jgi:hypothetical protein